MKRPEGMPTAGPVLVITADGETRREPALDGGLAPLSTLAAPLATWRPRSGHQRRRGAGSRHMTPSYREPRGRPE